MILLQLVKNSFLIIIVLLTICNCEKSNAGESELKKYYNKIDSHGYNFRFITKDIERDEFGSFTPEVDGKEGTLYVAGNYKFIAPNGVQYVVYYQADQNGYRASSKPEGGYSSDTAPRGDGIGSKVITTLGGGF